MRFYRLTNWIVIVASVSLVFAGCYPSSPSDNPTPALVTVEVDTVRNQTLSDPLSLIGKIEPAQETTMYFEVSGIVKEIFVREGSDVEKDDLIAALHPQDYRYALQQAKSRRKAAKARLDLLLAGTRREELDVAKAELNRAAALQVFWKAEYSRRKTLFDNGGAVTESDFQQALSQRDAAVAAHAMAKAKNELAINGPRKEEIVEARAAIQTQIKAVAIARRQLAKASLKAPFAGRVEKRFVDAGGYVNVFPTGGVPVVHIVDLSSAYAVVSVPESLLSKFKTGNILRISSAWNAGAIQDTAIKREHGATTGTITAVGQMADAATGTYELRVRVPNAKRRFTAGMTIIATLDSAQPRQGIRVPATIIRYAFGQRPYVFIIEPESGVVQKREIVLGPSVSNEFVVTEGLEQGELLIVAGQHRVVEGDRVEYRKKKLTPAARDQNR